MKLGLLFAGVLALGCSKSVPPKAAEAPIHGASVEDCAHVYERVIGITLTEQLEPGQLFSKEAVETGAALVDQHFSETGKKQHFFAYCTTQLNTQQTDCMVSATSLDGMSVCAMMFADKTKKNP